MSKVLVGYWSGTGCTAGVAERIGATLAGMGMQVDVRSLDTDPRVADYDAVVVGSGVRAGSWNPGATKWVARNAAALGSVPLALFSVGIAMAHGPEKVEETRRTTERVVGRTGVRPRDMGLFAGWYVPRKFSFIERRIMRIAKAPEGDHRDWAAIEAWAAGLERTLQTAA